MEVTNKLKGLDLIDRVPEELWMQVVQEAGIKTIPKEKKKAKWLSEEALQRAVNRREATGKGEKERYTYLNPEFQRIARGDKKPSSVISAKKQKKTTKQERLEISSRKLEIPRENFMQNGLNKGQKWYGPNRSRSY